MAIVLVVEDIGAVPVQVEPLQVSLLTPIERVPGVPVAWKPVPPVLVHVTAPADDDSTATSDVNAVISTTTRENLLMVLLLNLVKCATAAMTVAGLWERVVRWTTITRPLR